MRGAPGWLEAELGGALRHNDIEPRDRIPYALKFARNAAQRAGIVGEISGSIQREA